MNPFDIDLRWKIPECLTQYICLIKRLGRLRRLTVHHSLAIPEYQKIRNHWHFWQQLEDLS